MKSQMFKVAILSIGDEICIGQIINTNSAWIGERLSCIGADVVTHVAIPDSEPIILAEISRLFEISDLVITTGGLGPTSDDITKPTLAKFFNDKLVLNIEYLKHIEDLLSKRNIRITQRNREMANLPSQCILLSNRVGTAPGMLFENGKKHLISLPGIPTEMKAIFDDHVIDFVQDRISQTKSEVMVYKTILTSGIAESLLAEIIDNGGKIDGVQKLAYLPNYYGVRLRVTSYGNNIDEAKAKLILSSRELESRVKEYVIGYSDDNLPSIVGEHLKSLGYTISVAESCTGGALGVALTDVPGSSQFFVGGMITYSNDSKSQQLGIDKELIEKYGAVSNEIAQEMAVNIKRIFKSDLGVSITGIAGPSGGSPSKPVGTVFIGLATNDGIQVQKLHFSNDRDANRQRSVGAALNMIIRELRNNKSI